MPEQTIYFCIFQIGSLRHITFYIMMQKKGYPSAHIKSVFDVYEPTIEAVVTCDLDQPISYSAVRLLVLQEVLACLFPIRPLGDEGAWKASQSDSTISCSVIEKCPAYVTFAFMHLPDAFIQSDFQKRALQKCIGH